MTNIFNKNVLARNGTLIGNWFEEEVLREKTGEGRTNLGKHISKINRIGSQDETFPRVMGQSVPTPYYTTNNFYGTSTGNEKKFQRVGVKDRLLDNFFKTYLENENSENQKFEEMNKNIRLFNTKNNSSLMPGAISPTKIGKRQMATQDIIPIEKIDQSRITKTRVGGYIDKSIPYYKDKEITYWSMNVNKGNMYRSHNAGPNAFAKSSGFTQSIHNTKTATGYSGNVRDNPNSKNIYLNENDEDFSQKIKFEKFKEIEKLDYSDEIKGKILSVCASKGWAGLRTLRIFFRNLLNRTNKNGEFFLNKYDFKFYLINFGILLNDREVTFIFSRFDHERKDQINFYEYLDSLTEISEERRSLLNSFYENVKNSNNSNVSFKKLEKLFSVAKHPEVFK